MRTGLRWFGQCERVQHERDRMHTAPRFIGSEGSLKELRQAKNLGHVRDDRNHAGKPRQRSLIRDNLRFCERPSA